jgi:ubiquinone/menaquinone biosynthesis C-methylase UbiE
MAQAKTQADVNPQKISEDLFGVWKTQALVTAVELDVFTHISEGRRTAKEVARAAGASAVGVERLLNALAGMGYLNKSGDRFALEPVADAFLVKGKDAYMGGSAMTSKLVMPTWMRLTEVIKRGEPIFDVGGEEDAREFFPKLVTAMFPGSFAASRAAVAAIPERTKKRISSILDIAAGSGAWSLAFATSIPDARVTVVDFPEVTSITRQYAERFGVADRYDYVEGNLREVDFGRDKYDLVIHGHIIHSEGEKWGKKLIKKSYRALKDGGLLLIAEMVPNDTRTGPAFPLLFGLNMFLHTEQGDVFTMREYREWLKGAGFKKVTTVDAPAPSPLILATK